MSKYNEFALSTLATVSLAGYFGLLILEFSARGLTAGTALLAFFGMLIYAPLMWYSIKDFENNTHAILLMFGAPLALMGYGLFTMVWMHLFDAGIALLLIGIGWIQLSYRIVLNRKLVKV